MKGERGQPMKDTRKLVKVVRKPPVPLPEVNGDDQTNETEGDDTAKTPTPETEDRKKYNNIIKLISQELNQEIGDRPTLLEIPKPRFVRPLTSK